MTGREIRAFQVGDFRVTRAEGKPVIEGHAAVFGKKEEIFGFTEEVAPGAFRQSLLEDDIRALFNHNDDFVLGRNRSGTLDLKEDDTGLFMRIFPPDTQTARDLLVSIERGDISGASIGFEVKDEEWSTRDGMPHRVLKRAKLWDVSPVTFPAFPTTDVSIAMRSLERQEIARREAERRGAIARAEEQQREIEILKFS